MSNRLADYDFEFPQDLIAQEPLERRDASRMMVLSSRQESVRHAVFQDLPEFLNRGDLVVVNDTSVLASRLYVQKPTGGRVEVFLTKSLGDLEWAVFFSPLRGLKEGMWLQLFSRERNQILSREIQVSSLAREDFRIRFKNVSQEREALEFLGEMPLPPYIKRARPRPQDRERYQTVFCRQPGAVAAPTAGLHFTATMQKVLRDREIHWASLTLHVGPGTFLPVKVKDIREHSMHSEYYEIPPETQRALVDCRQRGGRVLAVGTTTLRALESLALTGQAKGWADLFIRPGFSFQWTDSLLTNFHQPQSTLLILVVALAGKDFILRAYREALGKRYRLFSYGDCMLIRT